jgi:hypothetical protein
MWDNEGPQWQSWGPNRDWAIANGPLARRLLWTMLVLRLLPWVKTVNLQFTYHNGQPLNLKASHITRFTDSDGGTTWRLHGDAGTHHAPTGEPGYREVVYRASQHKGASRIVSQKLHDVCFAA